MPSFNPAPTFNERDPSEARFHPLDVGLVVSITHNHSNPLAATVAQVGPELVVQLARPHQKLPFQQGDQVRIKYWDEDRIAYFWQANVTNVSSVGFLTLSTLGAGMTIQQRKSYRVSAAIPVSFTIIDASDIRLNGEKVPEVMSQNISVGGVFFEQGLLLTVADKLELRLHLPSSEPVYAVGWVVRCEPISVDKRPLHSVAVEFLQIDETNQFRLMESLVQLQQELGQAGLPANDHRQQFRSIQRAEGKTKLTVLREWLAKQPSTRKQILKGTNINADTLSDLLSDKTMFRRDGDKRWHLVKEVSRKTSAE